MKTNKILVALATAALLLSSCNPSTKVKYTGVPAPADVVMYQVNPRNYAPEDSFKEVRKHLGEVQELGANVVWFMPICEIGIEKAVKSPYCVKDYKAVNPEFGTIEDFKAIVDECHSLGMSVIIDWVANHTSWDNQWIKDNPEWYTHNEEGQIISPAGTGWNDVADLNFDNPDMCAAMIDAMKFWVNEIGIDGFRCDAADYVPFEFWKDACDQLRESTDKTLLLLAEGQRKDHFQAGFDLNYAWGWLSSLRKVFTGETVTVEQPMNQRGGNRPGANRPGGNRPAAGNVPMVRRTITRQVPVSSLFATDSSEYAGLAEGKIKLRFTTNHDEAEKMSPVREFHGNQGSLAAFVATTYIHGGMLIYGCQEVAYPGTIHFFNYTPVDWSANRDMYNAYKDIVRVFKANSALRSGSMVPYPDNNILMFERKDASETVFVAINMRDNQNYIALPEQWKGKTVTDLFTGKTRTLSADRELLKPFEYIVVK